MHDIIHIEVIYMLIIELVLVILFLCFIAICLALLVISENRKKQSLVEEVNIRAEVVKTNTDLSNMSVDNSNNYDHTDYFIEFKTDTNRRIVLGVPKKVFCKTLPGFYGDVIYKGNKLVSFTRLESHEEARFKLRNEEEFFFIKKTKRINPIEFYCDSPTLNVHISSEEAIKLDVDEVIKFMNRMLENDVENYFGLDNKEMIIQFFNDGTNKEIHIDIPNPKKGASYQTTISGIIQAKTIVRAYYRGENVFELADFKLMKL